MKSLLIFTTLVFTAGPCFALVDMNNANYSNTWTDLQVPGSGFDLKVIRAYKSRTLYNGIFGFGWCSEFETKLTSTPEGGIKINECGDGLEVYYTAREVSKDDVEITVNNILAKLKEKPQAGTSSSYWSGLRKKLLKDIRLRENYARENGIQIEVPKNVKLMANGLEVEYVILEKEYYTRHLGDGSMQRFDLTGRLTHMYNKTGQFLRFTFKDDLLVEVSDDNQRKLSLKYYPNKKVHKITGPNGLVSEYKYSDTEDLIWNKNAWAKSDSDIYTYEYNDYHNLVKATWPDKTFISIRYDNQKDWVLSFIDRDKCVENYKYEASSDNPSLHYWSTVTKTCGKDVTATNRYEFWHKELSTGQTVLSRVRSSVNSQTKDITYSDNIGKPTRIVNNDIVTNYVYYPNGLVKTKSSSKERQDFEYQKEFKKISKVVTVKFDQKGKVVLKETSTYKYDKKGNLYYAENSKGKKINITYDLSGRIKTIVDNSKMIVELEYEDKFGKPTQVTKIGAGTINIAYGQNGQITKVESKQGPIVATKIAGTFNSLLEILAPASQEMFE